jgi:diadenosine tetraphosphate (Ap4A) HIT family hydrolase
MNCPFCNPTSKETIIENKHAYARYDIYPVSKGHMLIIPKRHYADFFDSTVEERESLFDLVNECKIMLDDKYQPQGYNIGINVGQSAGQTVFHLHIHLIPRYKGDMQDPRGGVRGVIPEKQSY